MSGARFFDKLLELCAGLLRRLAETLRQVIQPFPESIQQLAAALYILLEPIQTIVVPTCQHFLRTPGDKRDMDLDFSALSDSIEPSDPLFKQFRIERKIK